MPEQLPLSIQVSERSDTIVINSKCRLLLEGDQRAVTVAGMPFHHFAASDGVAEAYAMVHLADAGFATQNEIARAFGCTERTVRRNQRRYSSGGMAALAVRSGWRAGRRRIATQRLHVIERAKANGLSNRQIAQRLGVTENAIRKQFPGDELTEAAFTQPVLPFFGSEAPAVALAPGSSPVVASKARVAAEPVSSPAREVARGPAIKRGEPLVATTLDGDPDDRTTDRLLACLGLLSDATPLFGHRSAVTGGGVLFTVPALVASGLFGVAGRLYGEIGPAFYGLRTSLMTLLFMALWRVKRSESLKEHPPAMLGSVLGLDRVPEVKTLRRKLARLAQLGRATLLGRTLARLRVERRGRLMGFLYIDGHVRAYHGKHTLPKTHVARMRLSMPATTDYWVNDRSGDPLFVVTAEANAALTKMMPKLQAEIRRTVGQRRVTVVFDRGGWSPKLFRKLLAQRFDILTYRKGKAPWIDPKLFVMRQARLDGHTVKYWLHDQPVRFLKGRLRLRQVTRLSDDGCHQTQVITSRWDLKDVEVAYRMFERWRQENFFKYMREEFLLDALCDYKTDPDDPSRSVPNPERHALDKEVSVARIELAKLEQQYGSAAMDNRESRRPTMRGFKISHGKVGKSLRAARARLAELKAKRGLVPKRVEVRDVTDGAVVKLATERKHLTNILKMVAYQAESDLLAALRPHYARADDEGRTLLQELLRAPADISATNDQLQVTLCPLSSPHRTSAVRALCAALNETETLFPGTTLRISYDVHAPLVRGMAFPGPRPAKKHAKRPSRSPKPDSSREG